MTERWYGSKYDENLGTKEIAALVRAEVKALVKAGALPKGTYSVTMQRFAGGSSIDVHVKNLEGVTLFRDEAFALDAKGRPMEVEGTDHPLYPESSRFTPETRDLVKKLEGLLQAYNHDGSDSMTDHFDVKFYGHASLGWEYERDEREALRVRLTEKAKVA